MRTAHAATIHRLPTTTRRGGGPATGDTLAEDSPKLDRALEMLGDLRVDVGRIAERQTADAEQRAAHVKDLSDLTGRHREDVRRLWSAIEELRARPAGWTTRQVAGAGAGMLAAAAALASIVDRLT